MKGASSERSDGALGASDRLSVADLDGLPLPSMAGCFRAISGVAMTVPATPSTPRACRRKRGKRSRKSFVAPQWLVPNLCHKTVDGAAPGVADRLSRGSVDLGKGG